MSVRICLLSPSLSEHYSVENVWSRKDEWEVVSRLSLSTLRVLYSNVNRDIRHGVHRVVGGLANSVFVRVFVCRVGVSHGNYACFTECVHGSVRVACVFCMYVSMPLLCCICVCVCFCLSVTAELIK